jgi:hypothetical protein
MTAIDIEQLAEVTGGRKRGVPVDTSGAQPKTQPKVGEVGVASPAADTVLSGFGKTQPKPGSPGLPVFVPFGAQKNHGGAASL